MAAKEGVDGRVPARSRGKERAGRCARDIGDVLCLERGEGLEVGGEDRLADLRVERGDDYVNVLATEM